MSSFPVPCMVSVSMVSFSAFLGSNPSDPRSSFEIPTGTVMPSITSYPFARRCDDFETVPVSSFAVLDALSILSALNSLFSAAFPISAAAVSSAVVSSIVVSGAFSVSDTAASLGIVCDAGAVDAASVFPAGFPEHADSKAAIVNAIKTGITLFLIGFLPFSISLQSRLFSSPGASPSGFSESAPCRSCCSFLSPPWISGLLPKSSSGPQFRKKLIISCFRRQ